MKSNCCYAALKTEHRVELFHGHDDGYDLVIPFLVCSKCGEIQLTIAAEEDSRKLLSIGGVK
jgi:hypothetical protein